MSISLYRRNQLLAVAWPGGTTTELSIYPVNSVYQQLKFDFRISTSTVELEATLFTSLPGVERKIMVLEGAMRLEHTGHRTGYLKKFDTDAFSGDWQTRSYGRCTDFNLMTRGETTGSVTGMYLEEGVQQEIEWREDFTIFGVYIFKGKMKTEVPSGELVLEEGDLLMVYQEDSSEILNFHSLTKTEIVLVKILMK